MLKHKYYTVTHNLRVIEQSFLIFATVNFMMLKLLWIACLTQYNPICHAC
jgi:hypothetical protein